MRPICKLSLCKDDSLWYSYKLVWILLNVLQLINKDIYYESQRKVIDLGAGQKIIIANNDFEIWLKGLNTNARNKN